MCVYVHMCVWKLEVQVRIFLYCSPLYVLTVFIYVGGYIWRGEDNLQVALSFTICILGTELKQSGWW